MSVRTEEEVRAIRERAGRAQVALGQLERITERDRLAIYTVRIDVPALVESHEELRQSRDALLADALDCVDKIGGFDPDNPRETAGEAIWRHFSAIERERDEWRATAEALRVVEARISGTLCDAADIVVDPLPEAVEALRRSRDEARAQWSTDMHRIAEAVAGHPVEWSSPEKGGWDYGTILGQVDELRVQVADIREKAADAKQIAANAMAERDQLRDMVAQLVGELEEVEWCGFVGATDAACPSCGALEVSEAGRRIHIETCSLNAAIRNARGEP